jgi:beta-lactamase superfamily II metal-dependent hydrolase
LNGICDFLYQITGLDEKEPLHIRMWYITHPDGDHFGAVAPLIDLLEVRGKKPIIDTFAFNFPGARTNTKIKEHGRPTTLLDCIKTYYSDSNYIKLHTGMVFNVGELKMEVLGTIENIVSQKKHLSYVNDTWDTNDTCSMARFTFGGRSILLMGDIRVNVEDMHLGLYSKEYIKSDIYQVPHHGYNLLYKTVEYCDPEYVLISNKKEILAEQPNKYNFYNSIVPKNRYFYAGDFTTALEILNGNISVTKLPRYDDPDGKV